MKTLTEQQIQTRLDRAEELELEALFDSEDEPVSIDYIINEWNESRIVPDEVDHFRVYDAGRMDEMIGYDEWCEKGEA